MPNFLHRYPLSELLTVLPQRFDLFLCCASYEDRCLSVALRLPPNRVSKVAIFQNADFVENSEAHVDALISHYGTVTKYRCLLSTRDPVYTADEIVAVLATSGLTSESRVLVDITTFTHEQLLILLAILREQPYAHHVTLTYTGAAEYMIGEDKWLSRGVQSIRSVLGYPGILPPSQNIHLVVLVGYELERAKRLVEDYEPSVVSLGYADPANSIRPEHARINRDFHQRLASRLSNVREFCFSCRDAESTKLAILKELSLFSGFSNVVAPLNTKISTVGAALAAFADPAIQLCYAQAKEYNTSSYSHAGETFYLVKTSVFSS